MRLDPKLLNLFWQNFAEAYRSSKLLQSSFIRMRLLMPLSHDKLKQLSPEKLDMIDAFRVRFCDLQDSIVNKVFRSLLYLEEESIGSVIDTINKMEKRQIIASFESFKKLRNIRNAFSHDYLDSDEVKVEILNEAYQNTKMLFQIINNILDYIFKRFGLKDPNFECVDI